MKIWSIFVIYYSNFRADIDVGGAWITDQVVTVRVRGGFILWVAILLRRELCCDAEKFR